MPALPPASSSLMGFRSQYIIIAKAIAQHMQEKQVRNFILSQIKIMQVIYSLVHCLFTTYRQSTVTLFKRVKYKITVS